MPPCSHEFESESLHPHRFGIGFAAMILYGLLPDEQDMMERWILPVLFLTAFIGVPLAIRLSS